MTLHASRQVSFVLREYAFIFEAYSDVSSFSVDSIIWPLACCFPI